MKKALAFDCDGTLLDTRGDYLEAINKTLLSFNLKPIALEQVTEFLGYGTDYLVRHSVVAAGAQEDFAETFKPIYLKEYFSHVFVKTKEYPGTSEALRLAQEKGYKLIVASNKPDAALQELISKAFPQIRFDLVLGQVFGTKPKPDRYMFDQVFEKTGLEASDICYFGDTEVDWRFAENAGVKNLYIFTYGFRSEKYLREHTSPKAFLKSMADLKELIEKDL